MNMNDYFGGYGFYIFSAYGCVLSFLLVTWYLPWRRHHSHDHKNDDV